MNQQRGNNGGGQPAYSENQQIVLKQKLGDVLKALAGREAEIAAVLPPDQTFRSFHATINQALRANPELLDCEFRSLINACVKAGYDGLRIDGKEAAIVWEMASVPGSSRKVKMARYMPMYQGLVQQVLRGGLVLSCEADVIYANDKYKLLRGTDSGIFHEPLLKGDRGEMIAAYNVARLKSGVTTFAYLTREQINDIAMMSKSGWDKENGGYKGVWARWTREQWKKTVLRQHRKTLPVGLEARINDSESDDEFPAFAAGRHPHPQFLEQAGGARPTRQAIQDRSGTETGTAMDLGSDERVVEHAGGGRDDAGDDREQQQETAQQEQDEQLDIPGDGAEWEMWAADLRRDLSAAQDAEAVDQVWRAAAPVFAHAAKPMQEALRKALTDRNTQLALGDE